MEAMPITMKFRSSKASTSQTQKAKSKSPVLHIAEGTTFIKSQLASMIDRMFSIVKTDLVESTLLVEAEKRNNEIKKFVETRAANTIARAYKSRKEKLDAATTAISKIYRARFTRKNSLPFKCFWFHPISLNTQCLLNNISHTSLPSTNR